MKNALRKEFTHTIHVKGDCKEVFKAFCPEAEKKWVSGWESTMLYSKSGIAEKNCVFTTTPPNMPETVWVCSVYDFGREVEYIKTTPGQLVSVINITTRQVGEDTECTVKYVHTALTAAGTQYILSQLSEEQFIAQISTWETGIPIYLGKETH